MPPKMSTLHSAESALREGMALPGHVLPSSNHRPEGIHVPWKLIPLVSILQTVYSMTYGWLIEVGMANRLLARLTAFTGLCAFARTTCVTIRV